MKKLIFLIIVFSLSSQTHAQELLMESELVESPDVSDAKFNGGGFEKFNEYIQQQFNYSKVKKAGKMVAAFTIDKEGSVKNIKLIEFIDMDSATELIRVLNNCPKWIPAKRGGNPISIEVKYPMVFKERPKAIQENRLSNTADATVKPAAVQNDATLENDPIYNTAGVEKRPDFPGGMGAFYKYIATKYRAPYIHGLKGKVFVTFIVEKNGSIEEIKVLRDIGHGTGEEAIRVLSHCPKWIPGEQQGKKVRVFYSLPINIDVP